ncbi:hypothetical protein [Paraburkholderia sprentiae]|uniref:Uncharacterized protein n=1 Tax=Paraburkholderia sprentiae WSM5005 TaxID=754502 RepID=A0A1I9YIK8_9BURK|nr:hypothetical protein [Paraburkholderia sprentiae]
MTMIREVVIRYAESMEILSVDHVGPYVQIGNRCPLHARAGVAQLEPPRDAGQAVGLLVQYRGGGRRLPNEGSVLLCRLIRLGDAAVNLADAL